MQEEINDFVPYAVMEKHCKSYVHNALGIWLKWPYNNPYLNLNIAPAVASGNAFAHET